MQRDGLSEIRGDYSRTEVERLAGSFQVRHSLAEMGAPRLRHLLATEPFLLALGALTGNQAVQQVKAGLKAIYLSGWQVAAEPGGYTATRHQREVGVGYFDAVALAVSGGQASTTAL
jgi:isocitrate lyase